MNHINFFPETFESLKHNSKNIGYVFHGSHFIKPSFIKPLDVWEHNLTTCLDCKNNFEIVKGEKQKQLGSFPNCCIQHKKLANQSWFKRKDFENVPQQYAEKLLYSWFHILHFSSSENWRKEIFDYLEYAIKSFGAFPNDYGEPLYLSQYLSQLKAIIENSFKTIYSKDISKEELLKRLKEIIEYLDKVGKVDENYKPTNLNLLIEIYNKWFKIFPFEISFFSEMKPHFEKQLPLLNGKPETNKYTGLTKAKMHTKGSLIDTLLNVTNNLLTQINTISLYEKGLLTEPQKIKLELVLNERKMKLKQGYVNSSKDEEQQYRKILKEWFADEKRFIDEVTPLVKAFPRQKTETKGLSVPSIALKHFYEGLQITRENADEIAAKHGYNSKSSGEGLFQDYTFYSSTANRKGKPFPCTVKKLENKIKLIESVIELLPTDKQERAKDEVLILKGIYEAEYQ